MTTKTLNKTLFDNYNIQSLITYFIDTVIYYIKYMQISERQHKRMFQCTLTIIIIPVVCSLLYLYQTYCSKITVDDIQMETGTDQKSSKEIQLIKLHPVVITINYTHLNDDGVMVGQSRRYVSYQVNVLKMGRMHDF